MSLITKEKPPITQEFLKLREIIGWNNPSEEIISSSINNSLYWVSTYSEGKLVATGRVVGDGKMYFYIQDVLVHPKYQGQGIGTEIMSAINNYLESVCHPGSTIGLLAAKGKEGFYAKFGYSLRTGSQLGLGMCKFV